MKREFEELKEAIKGGIIPATVTPWTPEYELDEESLHRHVSDLATVDGLVAVIANAHSGEAKMADMDVKEEVIRAHQEATGDDAYVFSGVAGESTLQAAEQARRAEAAGADAIMPVPIDVYSHGDPQILLDHYQGIADAVDIPLIVFQFGNYGDIAQPIRAYVEAVKMDEVIALKDATFDPVRYEKTVRALEPFRDEFTLLTGDDTFLFHSYHLGAESALISYANLIPDMHVEKLRAVHDGDMERAMELRREMMPLTNFLFGDPPGRYRARVKEALEMMGTFEHATVLPPQQPLDTEERSELQGILQDLGEL